MPWMDMCGDATNFGLDQDGEDVVASNVDWMWPLTGHTLKPMLGQSCLSQCEVYGSASTYLPMFTGCGGKAAIFAVVFVVHAQIILFPAGRQVWFTALPATMLDMSVEQIHVR